MPLAPRLLARLVVPPGHAGGVAAMFWALLQCFVLLHGEPPLQRARCGRPDLLALGLALFLAGFCGEYRLWRRRAGC